ncbi:MAG: NAD(P)/FAD-dependent oxidoreductase [Aurantimonas coralicida]|uniref:Putative glutathione reductase n=1 Tax=Aurantimonas manganoxydans (strain ATCC BAA-1229 / DSM 21871 / SI85-9A1) TaxID=287752 RepID=Q1YJ06_AURMS|nr:MULTISPECIES: NAD(P)/FAD-dependent oxidoreductase [Aurantimonadaceae]EAS49961.1 putative glutathione reductase [Aurantimonas manganoxydans SI85-9A1]MAU97129.1 NAD(P)/FAD-dependent oxidoreductase [Fulvimarina sp.]MCQ0989891.1 NAD(P)/FAD-dependent oxidoreductase [Jiella sp. LLJ827]
MAISYDLLIIGTGTAAMVAAMRVRAAGWSVAVADFRSFGGTCALRGCDPKKMMIGGTDAADHAWRMQGHGVEGDTHLEWPGLLAFKRSFTVPIPDKHEQRYEEKGIDTFHGRARFTGPNTLDIGGTPVEARHVLIAAGAEPLRLGIPGEEHLIDNEGFLELERLPKRIVLVGGGYIAAEFSHIAARAGAKVTIFQHGERMLKHFDPDLVGWLMDKFRDLGIDVRTDAEVTAIEKSGEGYRVSAMDLDGELTVEADLVVHAAGRKPALTDLDLAAAGIKHENGRLVLNAHLQSVSNPTVYAAGDAAQMGPPLTPVSSHDAKVAAANLLEGNKQRPNYDGVPSVAFTIPPIAAVGLTEAEARDKGMKFGMKSARAEGWFTARQAAEKIYGFKVLVDKETDLVLGAHLVGPHADEVINIFALAIRHGITAEKLKSTMFAYPSGASDIGSML